MENESSDSLIGKAKGHKIKEKKYKDRWETMKSSNIQVAETKSWIIFRTDEKHWTKD